MRKAYALAIAACMAVPFATGAVAKPAQSGMVLYDAAGIPVGVLTPFDGAAASISPGRTAAEFDALPLSAGLPAEFIAEQDAMMRDLRQMMMAIDALAVTPFEAIAPNRTIEVALRDAARAPGSVSGMIVTSFSSGGRECSQTVTYAYPRNGASPNVTVRKIGNDCGAVTPPSTQAMPAARSVTPRSRRVMPFGAPLYRVEYRSAAPERSARLVN
jgi:hypothetical protein